MAEASLLEVLEVWCSSCGTTIGSVPIGLEVWLEKPTEEDRSANVVRVSMTTSIQDEELEVLKRSVSDHAAGEHAGDAPEVGSLTRSARAEELHVFELRRMRDRPGRRGSDGGGAHGFDHEPAGGGRSS